MNAGVKINERTRKRLADFLGGLPPAHARALADRIQRAPQSGDPGLPYDLILEALRPVLDREEPSFGQGLTAAQLFALPFEDLIVEGKCANRPGRIGRGSAEAVWDWLRTRRAGQGGPAEMLQERANGAGLSRAAALKFWRACAQAIGEALDGESESRNFDPETAENAREMVAVLEIAADAVELRERFARPHGMLSTSALNALAVLFDDFADRHPGRAVPFFLLLAGRLERPWEVLRIMDRVAEQVHAKRLNAAEVEAVTEALFSDLEAGAEFFRRLNTAVFDPDRVVEELRAFTRRVDGLSRTGRVEGGCWARRMAACRSDVAEKMEILMERAPREIMAALPVHKIGRFGRVRRRPDIGVPPDPAKSEQALRMARLVDLCRPHAAEGAFKAAYSEAAADIRANLGEYADTLLELARAGAEAAERAQSWLDLVTRLMAHAVGPEEAGRLRRDAAAVGIGGLSGVAAS